MPFIEIMFAVRYNSIKRNSAEFRELCCLCGLAGLQSFDCVGDEERLSSCGRTPSASHSPTFEDDGRSDRIGAAGRG